MGIDAGAMEPIFKKIVVVGVGLIGGSFALALKQLGAVQTVIGVGRTPSTLARAIQLGIIDRATSFEEAIPGADLVLIATPVAQTAAILRSIAPFLQSTTVVTDAGSTKCDVVTAARDALGDKINQFVPAHPIAGRESNGPDAALADLYSGKKVVLTPLAENADSVIAMVAHAWRLCGASVHLLKPEQHDRIFAAVSHLPHLLAYALVDQIEKAPDSDVLFRYAASGFRDFTRIAGSSPEMWRDIALANRSALLEELALYSAQIARLQSLLMASDGGGLIEVFANAQRARQNWLNTIETAEHQPKIGGD